MTEPHRTQHPLQHIAPTAPQPSVEMHETVYRPGDTEVVPPSARGGWTHGYVVRGTVRLVVGDDAWRCRRGDSIVVDARRGYGVAGVGARPATVLWFSTRAGAPLVIVSA